MKKIMIIMLGLLLIAPAMAATEGQVLTQSQVDNVDIENYNFEPNWVTTRIEMIASCFVYPFGTCEVRYNYLSAIPEVNRTNYERTLTGNYVIKLFPKTIRFELQDYIDIRTETNSTYAQKELKQDLIDKTDRQFNREKERLTKYQTKQFESVEDIFGELPTF